MKQKAAPTHPIDVKETKRFEIASKHIRITSLDGDAKHVKLRIDDFETIVDLAELLDVVAMLKNYDNRPVMR